MDHDYSIPDKPTIMEKNDLSVHYIFIGLELDLQDTIASLVESPTPTSIISFKILPPK